jgi:hypothetical protein
MTDGEEARSKDSCPHCGKPAGLRWWDLLPSGARHRTLKCQACGGGYDLSDGSKMAAMIGGLVALGPAILLFGRIIKAGHGSKLYLVAATVLVVLAFGLASLALARITMRLDRKP